MMDGVGFEKVENVKVLRGWRLSYVLRMYLHVFYPTSSSGNNI